ARKEQEARDKEAARKEQEARDKEAARKEQEARDKEAARKEQEEYDKIIKNELISNLRNLIEISNVDREKYEKKFEEETADQYGITLFKSLHWGRFDQEWISSDSRRSRNFRKHVYAALIDMDSNDWGVFTEILLISGNGVILNNLNGYGGSLDPSIVHLYSKKDTLDKLDISDLEKLKNYFEELWSIKKDLSKIFIQILLAYKDNNNLIKTDNSKLRSYATPLFEQVKAKTRRTEVLVGKITSI
uniref:CRASP family complement regulator-acquiring lipoprotein n=1 Tax=Borreliella turdi TaxID=57863 RepID=UPI00124459F7